MNPEETKCSTQTDRSLDNIIAAAAAFVVFKSPSNYFYLYVTTLSILQLSPARWDGSLILKNIL